MWGIIYNRFNIPLCVVWLENDEFGFKTFIVADCIDECSIKPTSWSLSTGYLQSGDRIELV